MPGVRLVLAPLLKMEAESTVVWSVPAKDCARQRVVFDSRGFLCMVAWESK